MSKNDPLELQIISDVKPAIKTSFGDKFSSSQIILPAVELGVSTPAWLAGWLAELNEL